MLMALLISCSISFGSSIRASTQGICMRARGFCRTRTEPMASLSGKGGLCLEPPSEDDLEVLEKRQLGHKVSSVVGCGARCKHGFPQAFAYDPISRAPWVVNGIVLPRKSKLESGLFRLSCPLLVKAIDEWEAEGAVQKLNDEIRASADVEVDPSEGAPQSLAARLDAAHHGHAEARQELIGPRLPQVLEEANAAGEDQRRVVEMVLRSGIAGQTRSKIDIKCVHAQLADHLCRSESNELAAELVRRLETRGVAVRGDDVCCSQCDLAVPERVARDTWWYEPSKNKWKLRKRQHRRREKRVAAAAAAAGSASGPMQAASGESGTWGVEGRDAPEWLGLPLEEEERRLRELDRASG